MRHIAGHWSICLGAQAKLIASFLTKAFDVSVRSLSTGPAVSSLVHLSQKALNAAHWFTIHGHFNPNPLQKAAPQRSILLSPGVYHCFAAGCAFLSASPWRLKHQEARLLQHDSHPRVISPRFSLLTPHCQPVGLPAVSRLHWGQWPNLYTRPRRLLPVDLWPCRFLEAQSSRSATWAVGILARTDFRLSRLWKKDRLSAGANHRLILCVKRRLMKFNLSRGRGSLVAHQIFSSGSLVWKMDQVMMTATTWRQRHRHR